MPRLVDDAVRIVAGIAHARAVLVRVRAQPSEGGGALERFFRGRFARRTDIQRQAAVMFAVTGRGVHGEDVLDPLPARALLAFRLDVNEWRGERKVQFLVEGAQFT